MHSASAPHPEPESALNGLLAAQEFLVLERVAPGRFRVAGPRPAWASGWTDEELAAPSGPFPFLDVFLPDAEAHWNDSLPGPCRAGPWTQPGAPPTVEPLDLEVSAGRSQDRCYLLLRRLAIEHAERQSLLQQARELSLSHERLASEIEKREVLLHCIVHDLNGPLSAMLGCLEILKRDSLSRKGREVVAIGLSEAERLSHRIQELLDCFAADIADLDGTPRDSPGVDLLTTAHHVLQALGPAFQAKSVTTCLACDTEEAHDSWRVTAESSRLERVLYNLLENALRHSPSGGKVSLSLHRANDMIETSVVDTGRGIDALAASRIFQKFGKGRHGGRTGLGLYFCRITIERWGGQIGCENLASGGSRFWFRLRPVPRTAARA